MWGERERERPRNRAFPRGVGMRGVTRGWMSLFGRRISGTYVVLLMDFLFIFPRCIFICFGVVNNGEIRFCIE